MRKWNLVRGRVTCSMSHSCLSSRTRIKLKSGFILMILLHNTRVFQTMRCHPLVDYEISLMGQDMHFFNEINDNTQQMGRLFHESFMYMCKCTYSFVHFTVLIHVIELLSYYGLEVNCKHCTITIPSNITSWLEWVDFFLNVLTVYLQLAYL